MVSKIGDIECLLCDDLISFYDGETGIYQSHLELKHEVEEAKRDLVIAVCFLREKELQELVNKVQPRKEYFLEHGEEQIDDELDEELAQKLMNFEENYVNEGITINETYKIPTLDMNETKQIHPRSKHKSSVYSCTQCKSSFSAQRQSEETSSICA